MIWCKFLLLYEDAVSLIGIDVGTSALKVAAYREDGILLARARVPVYPAYRRPGWSELDPRKVWDATRAGLAQIGTAPELRDDPPLALAISASGDEVFPIDTQGTPLGPCILSGDVRGHDLEASTAQLASPTEWYIRCGHIPERMDPVNRILWWRKYAPEISSQTAQFLGWHEYLTLCLCGEAVTDPSLAGKWAIYDRKEQAWSAEGARHTGLDPAWLPRIEAWGTSLGEVSASLRAEWGFSRTLHVGVGAFDASCAALGAAVTRPGVVGLACGSWEVVTAPTGPLPLTPQLVESQFPLAPHPSEAGLALLAQSPNGSAVVEWATQTLKQELASAGAEIEASGLRPGPVMALPHFSGSILPQTGGRDSRAAFLGLTLGSTGAELLKALMESVAYDLALTLRLMEECDVPCDVLRAAGGGTRSAWWMQLKADLSATPVEVIAQPEPGTFGAALLAGAAAGVYPTAWQAAEAMLRVERRYEPDEDRRCLYADRLATYTEAITALLPTCRRLSHDHR